MTSTVAKLTFAAGAALVLLVAILGTAAAAAPSPAIAAGSSDTWAYGFSYSFGCNSASQCSPDLAAQSNITFTTLQAHLSIGAAAIFTQANSSTGYYNVSVEKVLAAHGSVEAVGSCTAATCGGTAESFNGNATTTGIVKEFSNASITNYASVTFDSNGTPAPAIGIYSGNSNEVANASGTASLVAAGLGFGSGVGAIYGAANIQAQINSVTFSPALGLIPVGVAPGEMWTSTSTWSATTSGSVAEHYYVPCAYWTYESSSSTCTDNSGGMSESVGNFIGTTGTVTVSGDDYGYYTIDTAFGPVTYQIIGLSFSGAVGTSDGVVIAISGFNFDSIGSTLVGTSSPTLHLEQAIGLAQPTPAAGVQPPDGLDYAASAGNLGIQGNTQDSNELGDLATYTGAATVPSDSAETPATAQSAIPGLVAPPASSSSSGGGSSSSSGLFLMVVVVAVVAVVVIVLAIMVRSKGKRKAALAPAATAGTAPPPAAQPATPAAAPRPTYQGGQTWPPPPPPP